MKTQKDETEAKFVLVTPEMAENWLKHNMPNNRNINKSVVKQYAEDMKRGDWSKSYEPIVINNLGLLENGQHRLSAICVAKIPIELYVITNAIPSPGSYDRGLTRSTIDALCVRGNLDKRFLQTSHTSTAKSILRDLGVRRASDSLLEDFMAKFGEDIDRCVCATRMVGSTTIPICKKSSIIKIIFYATYSGLMTFSAADRFCKIANSGFYSQESESSAVVMRNQVIQVQNITNVHCNGASGWKREQIYERLAALAISDFVDGKTRMKSYRVESCKTPKFVNDAIRILRMEITRS